jgi:hypothetical protein
MTCEMGSPTLGIVQLKLDLRKGLCSSSCTLERSDRARDVRFGPKADKRECDGIIR